MHRPSLLLAMATAGLVALTGCTGMRSARAPGMAAPGIAPDDVALRPNPNAPYLLPGGVPRLVRRATALDAENAGPCNPEVLSVEEIAGDANGTFRSVKLAFMNRGAAPCRLGGYPTVALLNSQGGSIGSIAMERVRDAEVIAELEKTRPAATGSPAPEVTLMPHAVAAFEVVWTTGAECSSVARILVTAPGTERTFAITQPTKVCTGRIQVTQLRLDEGDV